METTPDLIELTVRVVACFAAHNTIAAAELPALIQATHAALAGLSPERGCSRPHRAPAVPVEQVHHPRLHRLSRRRQTSQDPETLSAAQVLPDAGAVSRPLAPAR